MDKELVATIHCACGQVASIFGIDAGHGVKYNSIEPPSFMGMKECPECKEPLVTRRIA